MTSEIELKLPDGRVCRIPKGLRAIEVLEAVDRLNGDTHLAETEGLLGVRVGRRIFDLVTPLTESGDLRVVPQRSADGLEILRHSTSHVMASAVKELFPSVKVTIGPSIETGFYYDFDSPQPFSEEDLRRIEAKMKEIVARDEPFVRQEISKAEAMKRFKDLGETYKVELIEALDEKEASISLYTNGSFTDLCRGPHLPRTGLIKAFKLTHVAGAYWRGDEKNPMLQRIYGTAFYSQEALDDYLKKVEEAKKRDHRVLGPQLDLFSISEVVGPGLILWHPKGGRIRNVIETFWKEEHFKAGYELLYSPHIARIDMWHQSGHTGFYSESMFSPMDVQNVQYIVKPMNCPFHLQVYRSALRSYRDLPLRWAELGTVYRFERSGALHGLLRVRGFTQDDAHIFCRPDQLQDEIRAVLKLNFHILHSFGFKDLRTFLSTRPEKYVGTIENWELATKALESVLREDKISYEIDPGEGVFYGPKIDIKMMDALGHLWQFSTVQVDFNLPERFDLTYVGEDGGRHRPIMIHRALMGSMERFFACLIEFYGGAWPVWLAPVQIRVMTITDRASDYGREIVDKLKAAGFRVEGDFRNEKLSFKVHEAQVEKIPYMIPLGDKEVSSGKISLRTRRGKQENGIEFSDFVARVRNDVESRAIW